MADCHEIVTVARPGSGGDGTGAGDPGHLDLGGQAGRHVAVGHQGQGVQPLDVLAWIRTLEMDGSVRT